MYLLKVDSIEVDNKRMFLSKRHISILKYERKINIMIRITISLAGWMKIEMRALDKFELDKRTNELAFIEFL